MMPTGHQSEIRNKAVFPSPYRRGLIQRLYRKSDDLTANGESASSVFDDASRVVPQPRRPSQKQEAVRTCQTAPLRCSLGDMGVLRERKDSKDTYLISKG